MTTDLESEDLDEAETGRRRYPELLTTERIVRLFEKLPDGAQARVMRYLVSRFGDSTKEDMIEEALTRR